MGMCLFNPIWAEKEHGTSFNELYYIVKGRVELEIGGASYKAGHGDILLVPQHTVHRDIFDMSSEFEVFIIFFSWAAEEKFISEADNDKLANLPESEKNEILKILDSLRAQDESKIQIDSMIARTKLHTLLLYILRGLNAPSPVALEDEECSKRKKRSLMLQAKNYLERHYDEAVTLEGIANDLNVSPCHLSRTFSSESSFSLFTYLTNLRMDKAKSMLSEGDMNISEIAETVGYENSKYFSKVFKRRFGKNPSDLMKDKKTR